MALLANGTRLHTHVNRAWGGNSVAGIYGLGVTANQATFTRGSGCCRNWYAGDAVVSGQTVKSALPNGYNHPYAWLLPRKAGGMSSHNQTLLTVSGTASGAEGLNAAGSTSFLITTDATGQLIASAIGTSSFAVTATGSVIATLGAPGTASFAITATGTVGALAWAIGEAPLSVTCSLVPYGIGHMVGSALPYTELSPQSLAAAVWGTVLEGTYTAAEVQKIMAAALAGKVSGSAGSAPVFRSIDDTADRISATVDANGDRLTVALNV
jgi:hypothetical protein